MQVREKERNQFHEKLVEQGVYLISKFQVARAMARNLATMRDYMIYLTARTVVEVLENDPAAYPAQYFEFLDRDKMMPFVNTDNYLTGQNILNCNRQLSNNLEVPK